MPVLHSQIQAVVRQLEAATHSRGALFLVRAADDPWPVLWAKGPDVHFGQDAADLVADPTSWWRAVATDDRQAVRTSLEEAGNDRILEYRLSDPGRGVRWVRESLRRVSVPGQGDYLVSVTRDITAERAAERTEVLAPAPALDPAATGGSGRVVLLVEDDEAVRAVLARVLVREGFTTLLAGTAGEALRIFEKAPRRVEILVCDVILPDRSGPELVDALTRRRPELPVLLMSGYGQEELERRGDLVLGHPLLPKPFTPSDLVEAVWACLRIGRRGGSGVMSGPESAAS